MRNIFFLFIIGFLVPACVHAQIVMTEVMYDVEGTDTGREWIEVRNDGVEAVDLSLWKLFEANVNHKLTPVGASIVPAGGFAIIADVSDKFLADHVGFQGLIFDSAFSLNNAGETITIKDQSGQDSDSLSYLPEWGAAGDGLSLQKTSNNSWIAAAQTLGSNTVATQSEIPPTEDTSSSDDTDNTSTESVSRSSYSSQSVANTGLDEKTLTVTSGRSRIGFTGVPLVFRAKIKKINDKSLGLEHAWSMGDSSYKYGSVISYAYRFPGDYNVVLNSRAAGGIDAVSLTKVKILDPKVSISSANSDYIEIFNQSDEELNIGGMILRTGNKRTEISEDTIIAPHAAVRLPSSSTKLTFLRDFISLDSPTGQNFATIPVYEPVIVPPDGMSLEDVRIRFINALKKYE